MKNLQDILLNVSVLETVGNTETQISGLVFDSRKIEDKSCFFAQKGTRFDAHEFIPQVIADGATVIVCEDLPVEQLETICYVKVANASVSNSTISINSDSVFAKSITSSAYVTFVNRSVFGANKKP